MADEPDQATPSAEPTPEPTPSPTVEVAPEQGACGRSQGRARLPGELWKANQPTP
jgi:hypothetical protein